ncbi:MAG TPA: HAD-IIA family hydrolase [Polyangiaceae bacterium]|nr:HAD-IIA family hydrolase [Polyangiaceae bacterium]
MLTTSFASLVARYRVIFFDAYGVLKNARGVLRGVPELLSWILRQGKDVYVITNDASRSPTQMAAAYAHPDHGALIPEGKIISSGLLAKDFLRAKLRSGRVAYLGKPASAFYIESAGLTPVHVSEYKPGEDVVAVALLDDEGFDWFRDLNIMLNMMRRVSAPVIVANPDLVYPVNDHEVGLAVGSLAGMLERIVGKAFIRFGKPDTMMFSHAFACAHENVPNLHRSDVLMVGDTLETDILGANTFGLDTALVLSGNTQPEQAAVMIAAKGIIPTYLCESVFT